MKKCFLIFTKMRKKQTIFYIDNNKKCVLSTKTEYSDHLKLETGVMANRKVILN